MIMRKHFWCGTRFAYDYFTSKLNLMENLYCYVTITGQQITTNCMSAALVSCVKFCSDCFIRTWTTGQPILHEILLVKRLLSVILAPDNVIWKIRNNSNTETICVKSVCGWDLFHPAMYIPQDEITLREAELLHGYQIPSISSYIRDLDRALGKYSDSISSKQHTTKLSTHAEFGKYKCFFTYFQYME